MSDRHEIWVVNPKWPTVVMHRQTHCVVGMFMNEQVARLFADFLNKVLPEGRSIQDALGVVMDSFDELKGLTP